MVESDGRKTQIVCFSSSNSNTAGNVLCDLLVLLLPFIYLICLKVSLAKDIAVRCPE